MNPDSHRQGRRGRNAGRSDDIEVQAVLGNLIANLVAAVADAVRRVRRGIPHPLPGRVQMLRDGESRRFLRIRHAQEEVLAVLRRVDAGVRAVPGLDDWSTSSKSRQGIGEGCETCQAGGQKRRREPTGHRFVIWTALG